MVCKWYSVKFYSSQTLELFQLLIGFWWTQIQSKILYTIKAITDNPVFVDYNYKELWWWLSWGISCWPRQHMIFSYLFTNYFEFSSRSALLFINLFPNTNSFPLSLDKSNFTSHIHIYICTTTFKLFKYIYFIYLFYFIFLILAMIGFFHLGNIRLHSSHRRGSYCCHFLSWAQSKSVDS